MASRMNICARRSPATAFKTKRRDSGIIEQSKHFSPSISLLSARNRRHFRCGFHHSVKNSPFAALRAVLVAQMCAAALAAQSLTPEPSSEPKQENPQQLDRFVVTGSYIPSTETAIDAGA